jgi:hypothetical protein
VRTNERDDVTLVQAINHHAGKPQIANGLIRDLFSLTFDNEQAKDRVMELSGEWMTAYVKRGVFRRLVATGFCLMAGPEDRILRGSLSDSVV